MYGFLSHLHSLMGYDELEIHLSSELLNPSLTGAVIRSIDDDAALMLRVVLLRPRCARYEEGGNQCRYIGELIAGSQSKLARRNIGTGIFSPISAPGTGPNQGPIVFRAVPKGISQGGNNTVRNVLVTYDFAMCRGGPGDDHAPEVFYEFKIRNESTVAVPFDLEMIIFSDLPLNT